MAKSNSPSWYIAAIALSILSPCLAGCDSDTRLTTECEGEIKSRLKSPSSYQRIKLYTEKHIISSKEEYAIVIQKYRDLIRLDPSKIQVEIEGFEFLRKSTDGGPTLYTLVFSYDAKNAFGTPLRDSSTCVYLSREGGISNYVSALVGDVAVDGQTNIQRSMGVFPPR